MCSYLIFREIYPSNANRNFANCTDAKYLLSRTLLLAAEMHRCRYLKSVWSPYIRKQLYCTYTLHTVHIRSISVTISDKSHFYCASYTSTVLAVIVSLTVCPSVCLSIRLSQVGVLQRWLNLGSHWQHHTIVQGLQFSDAKNLGEIPTRSPPTWATNRGGVGSNWRVLTNISLYLRNRNSAR